MKKVIYVVNIFTFLVYIVIVHCATRKKKIYFASVKFDARAKRGSQPRE